MLKVMGELWSGCDEESDGSILTKRIFKVYFSAGEGPLKIRAMTDLPKIGAVHPDDKSLSCRKRTISEPQGGDQLRTGHYLVTCEYSNRAGTSGAVQPPAANTKPWDMPPYNISYLVVDNVVPLRKAYGASDTQDNPTVPVVNTAGDPIQIPFNETTRALKFSYNLKTFDDAWVELYRNTINKAEMTVCGKKIPAKKGLLRKVDAKKVVVYDDDGDPDVAYTQVDIEIEITRKDWNIHPANLGLNFRDGDDKKRIYTDNRGNFGTLEEMAALMPADATDVPTPVDEPMKLNNQGAICPINFVADETHYLEFSPYFPSDWKSLSLPDKDLDA